MKIPDKAKALLENYPFQILLKKVLNKPYERAREKKLRKRFAGSELRSLQVKEGRLARFMDPEGIAESLSEEGKRASDHLLRAYKEHRFDLMGSGWLKWHQREEGRGIEGVHYSMASNKDPLEALSEIHRHRASEILELIDDEGYEWIDWQRDMRSGFRWDPSVYGSHQSHVSKGMKGADKKVPVELGRMQHLPRMAVLAGATKEKGEIDPYVQEFRSQVLDFIAMNPPGMGIQWSCPMDVGIRIADLLLAHDLFAQMDERGRLDEAFEEVFIDSVHQHARFILDHLEYQDGLTGNHYLFNIAGILFCGAYLPQSDRADRYFEMGIQETVRELFKQFFPSGANFEGSSSYHLLCSEMFFYCSALIKAVLDGSDRWVEDRVVSLSKWSLSASGQLRFGSEKGLPEAFLHRLSKVWEACQAMVKPNGEHPQIGDNDSGRFFPLTPFGSFMSEEELADMYVDRPASDPQEQVFDENMLDARGVLAAAEGARGKGELPEAFVVRSFTGGKALFDLPKRSFFHPSSIRVEGMEWKHSERTELPFGASLDLSDAEWWLDPDSGFVFFRASDLHLSINAPDGKDLRHTWGHVHNDRGSFELHVAGRDPVVDPGSYVYGAFPEWRDRFRSTAAHNLILVDDLEQNRWVKGEMFLSRQEASCQLGMIEGDPPELEVLTRYRGVTHYRRFKIEEGRLLVEDRCDHPFRVLLNRGELHSRGFGKRMRTDKGPDERS